MKSNIIVVAFLMCWIGCTRPAAYASVGRIHSLNARIAGLDRPAEYVSI